MLVDQTLQDLVDALSAELERPVLLDDADLRPRAYSRQWGEIDFVRSESILSRGVSPAVREALLGQGIATAHEPVRTRGVPDLGMEERVCIPVRHAGELCGYLWLLDHGAPVGEDDLSRARAAAARAAEALRPPRRSWLADEGPLVGALCSADEREAAPAAEVVRARRLLPAGPFVVLLAATPDGGELLAPLGARFSAGHVVAGAEADRLCVLLALADPVLSAVRVEEVAERVYRALRGGADAPAVGQSGVARSLRDAHRARGEAEVALRVARGSGGNAHAAWDALGADRLVGRIGRSALGDVPPRLAALLRDEPVLARTVAAFLDAAGDVPATAAALSLHRSGVYYRLRRVEELTGLDFDRGDDRLLAHLALRLAALG